jgi:hypothetical protein
MTYCICISKYFLKITISREITGSNFFWNGKEPQIKIFKVKLLIEDYNIPVIIPRFTI